MTLSANSTSLESSDKTESALLEGDRIQPGNHLFGIIWVNPKRVSGTPCFYKTRVPVRNLFDSLEAGESLDEFLEGFEGVSREQAVAVLDLGLEGLLRDLRGK
jgi:uncharacterized protein (DUF433 family)